MVNLIVKFQQPSHVTSRYEKVNNLGSIKNLIPVKLDEEKLNFSYWSELFLNILEGLKAKPRTSKDTWDVLEKIFHDNKRSKTVELMGELRDLDMGDLSVDSYFRKIDSIATRLGNLGSNMSEEDIVTYAINGLSDKYDQVAHVILNRDPFHDLETARSMVTMAESRMNHKARGHSSTRITSSSPTILLAPSSSRPQVRTLGLITLKLFVTIFLVATVRMEKGVALCMIKVHATHNLVLIIIQHGLLMGLLIATVLMEISLSIGPI
ncbi:hybrid signal transduction histidine kinase M [Tanacetum coccineum]